MLGCTKNFLPMRPGVVATPLLAFEQPIANHLAGDSVLKAWRLGGVATPQGLIEVEGAVLAEWERLQ
jgi:hypothetical protein